MAEQIEAVLFDVDDTLCEYRQSGKDLLALAFEREGVEPFFDIEAYHGRYNEFTESTDTIDALRSACFAAIAEERGRDPDLGRAVAAAYADERDHRNVRPLSGACEAVVSLSHDHRLGIVTNGSSDMQTEKLDRIGITNAFEVVIHAGYDAPAKPDPEPFHRALSVLDVTPDSTVHVGNSLSSDVAGAQAAGVGAVWLSDDAAPDFDPDPMPEYTIDSMAELMEPPWNTSTPARSNDRSTDGTP